MVSFRRHVSFLLLVVALVATLLTVGAGRSEAKTAATKVSGKVSGRTNGKILAILSSGSTAVASIKSDGKFTLTLPRTSSKTVVNVTLQIVNRDGSYAGSVSIGKKKKASDANYKWYSVIGFPKGKTTALSTITWSASSKYGYVKLPRSSSLIPSSLMKRVTASNGKPAGAGRLGLARRSGVSSLSLDIRSLAVHVFDTNTDAGEDLDGDGIPNSLDIDDDGDGYPDPVDEDSGSKGTAPTSIYDAIGNLETGVSDAGNRVHAPINYNFLEKAYPDLSDLMAELSLLDDSNYYLWIRAVAPFFSDDGSKRMTDAWVDCSGLGWCLTADQNQSDPANLIAAPRLFPFGDGKIEDIWKYAFTNHSGSACDVHIPAIFTSDPSMHNCKPVKWADFSQKQYLEDAKTNGSPLVTQAVIDWATSHTSPTDGFGLYDPYIMNASTGGKGVNERGFDLMASIKPRGNSKFLENLTVGDVFYVNATLTDGSTARIAMTIPPMSQTAPTIFSFQADGDSSETLLDYVTSADCNSMGDPGCRYGDGRNPVMVSSSSPTLTLKFWRPQRLRVAETDTITTPFVDLGGLNYGVTVQDGSSNTWYRCSPTNSPATSAVQFTDTDGSEFEFVPSGGMSNESAWMRDPTADARPDGGTNADGGRYITLAITLNRCSKIMGSGPSTLNVSDTSTRFTVNLVGATEPKFGGNRSVTQQGFELKFQ